MSPLTELAELSRQFETEAAEVADPATLEALRVRWLGRKQGLVRQRLAAFKEVPPEQRRDYGQSVNELKRQVETAVPVPRAAFQGSQRHPSQLQELRQG